MGTPSRPIGFAALVTCIAINANGGSGWITAYTLSINGVSYFENGATKMFAGNVDNSSTKTNCLQFPVRVSTMSLTVTSISPDSVDASLNVNVFGWSAVTVGLSERNVFFPTPSFLKYDFYLFIYIYIYIYIKFLRVKDDRIILS